MYEQKVRSLGLFFKIKEFQNFVTLILAGRTLKSFLAFSSLSFICMERLCNATILMAANSFSNSSTLCAVFEGPLILVRQQATK